MERIEIYIEETSAPRDYEEWKVFFSPEGQVNVVKVAKGEYSLAEHQNMVKCLLCSSRSYSDLSDLREWLEGSEAQGLLNRLKDTFSVVYSPSAGAYVGKWEDECWGPWPFLEEKMNEILALTPEYVSAEEWFNQSSKENIFEDFIEGCLSLEAAIKATQECSQPGHTLDKEDLERYFTKLLEEVSNPEQYPLQLCQRAREWRFTCNKETTLLQVTSAEEEDCWEPNGDEKIDGRTCVLGEYVLVFDPQGDWIASLESWRTAYEKIREYSFETVSKPIDLMAKVYSDMCAEVPHHPEMIPVFEEKFGKQNWC